MRGKEGKKEGFMGKKYIYLLLVVGILCGWFSFGWGADMGLINSGETKSGTIGAPSYMDTWTFEGQAGDRVIINVVTTSGDLNTCIILYPPDGGPAEASTCDSCFYNHGGDQLSAQLQKTGLYTAIVSDVCLSRAGTYNITFLKIPGAVTSSEDPDGGSIASGETSSGSIIASDMDAFQFYGNTGDLVIINAVTTAGDLNTCITLYPQDGGPAEASTCDSCFYNHGGDQLSAQLQKTGLYTAIVSDVCLSRAGTYGISFSKIPPDLRPGIYNPFPANGTVICVLYGSFSWDPVAGATGYDLYFGKDIIEPLTNLPVQSSHRDYTLFCLRKRATTRDSSTHSSVSFLKSW